ncbi:unnamed protein product, partial [Tenebrio molitor]
LYSLVLKNYKYCRYCRQQKLTTRLDLIEFFLHLKSIPIPEVKTSTV